MNLKNLKFQMNLNYLKFQMNLNYLKFRLNRLLDSMYYHPIGELDRRLYNLTVLRIHQYLKHQDPYQI